MTKTLTLTADQIDAFKRDGFLIVRGLFDAAEMRDIDRWTDMVLGWKEVPGRHMVYYEDSLTEQDKQVVSRIENFCPFHEGFDALMNSGALSDMVSQLLGAEAVLFKEKINFKMPGGDGFKPHQDAQAGWNTYTDFHITALVSIDPATEENGCLEMVKGFHDKGLVGNEWAPLDDNAMADMDFVTCPTEPGDVVFFDSYAPHQSAPNFTDQPRRVLYITYNRASEGDHRHDYYADKRKSFPPNIEREAGKEYVFRV